VNVLIAVMIDAVCIRVAGWAARRKAYTREAPRAIGSAQGKCAIPLQATHPVGSGQRARSLSVAWCIICVMPGEDEIVVPDAWRQAVHPRRHGMAVLGPESRGLGDPGSVAEAVRTALAPVDDLVAGRGLTGAVTEFARVAGLVRIC
jgi:hypothetical protein